MTAVPADSPPPPGPRPRLLRRLGWGLVGLALLVPVLAAIAWIYRLPLAEHVAVQALQRAGIDAVTLHVEEVTPGRVVVTGVALGGADGWQVGRIEAALDLTNLAQPRLRSLVLSDVTARAAYGPDGLDLGALDPLLALGEGRASGTTGPPPVDEVKLERARLLLTTPYGPLELDLDGVGHPSATYPNANARFVLRGQGEEAAGSLSLRMDETALRVVLDSNSADDTLRVAAEIDPRSHAPMKLEVVAELVDVARLARFLPGLGALSGGMGLSLNYAAAGPWQGELRLTRLTVPGSIRDLDGTLSASADPATLQTGIVPVTGKAKATRLALSGTMLEAADLNLDGTIVFDPAGLGLLAAGDGQALAPAGVPLRAAELNLALVGTRLTSGALRGRAPRLELALGTTGTWPGLDIAIRSGHLAFAALELGSQARSAQAVRLDLGPAQKAPVRGPGDALALGFTVNAATLALEAAGQRVRLGLPTLAASITAGASLGLHVEGCCGTIALAAPKVDGTGLGLTLASAADKLLTARFTLKALTTPWTVPLVADGNFNMAGAGLRFDGTVTGPAGLVLATVAGAHDLDKAQGFAEAKAPRLTFQQGGLQPGQLSPLLAPLVANVSGTVAAEAALRWASGRTTSSASVLAEDLSFTTAEVPVSRMNTVVAFDSLLPPTTPPGQKVAVGAVTMGVPLTDGVVDFRLVPGAIAVQSASLGLAGGRVSLSATRVELPVQAERLALAVSGVSLEALLKVANVEGLSGDGVLDGTIPVDIADKALRIADGRLAARQAGVLRYTPQTYPAALQGDDERIQLLVRALRDFRYDRLGLGINRETDGEAVLALSVAGRNPAVLDGYPFELNLNLSGRLDQIVTEGLAGYRMPDDIRRRMQQFGNQE
ncbi:intermembrane phospholipid transport protein YdbH family protein [Zavarzinia sp. CC-PAN008]|uniref:intermembrane phospholipid transport protein YdbH family protein n=1 Tax=Zavarzinia sp. CC-PAN008 TaxID=3243332 RepID=UPI003F745FD1